MTDSMGGKSFQMFGLVTVSVCVIASTVSIKGEVEEGSVSPYIEEIIFLAFSKKLSFVNDIPNRWERVVGIGN